MARKPKASTINRQFDYDILALRDFCGDVLEDANDHLTAHALWSLNLGDVDLACDFLKIGRDAEATGEGMTPEIYERHKELLNRYSALQKSQRESPAMGAMGKVPRVVKSLEDLKNILRPGGSPYEFYIMLGGGARSSKQMHYNDPEEGWYWVRNEIDGTEQELDGDEALARETHIVEAIEKGAFIYTGHDE